MSDRTAGGGDERRAVPDPERGSEERLAEDPLARRVPMVEGPTGSTPLGSEMRGNPEDEGDRRAEKGTMAGAVAGTAVGGPIGGLVGAVVGGIAGAARDDSTDGDARGTSDAGETAGTVLRGGTTEPEPPPG